MRRIDMSLSSLYCFFGKMRDFRFIIFYPKKPYHPKIPNIVENQENCDEISRIACLKVPKFPLDDLDLLILQARLFLSLGAAPT
jgi:hypothetical protein